MKTQFKRIAVILSVFLATVICCPAPESLHRGVYAAESYTFGVVPQFEQRKLHAIWDPIIEELEKRTGLKFKLLTTLKIQDFEKEFAISVSLTTSPIKDADDRIVGASTIAHDITDRKRAEEEIRTLNAELEQRVKERTAELEEKNAELGRLNRIFVGREMRMIELKERIRELETRLSGES